MVELILAAKSERPYHRHSLLRTMEGLINTIMKEKYRLRRTSGQKVSGAAKPFGGEDNHVGIVTQFRFINCSPL